MKKDYNEKRELFYIQALYHIHTYTYYTQCLCNSSLNKSGFWIRALEAEAEEAFFISQGALISACKPSKEPRGAPLPGLFMRKTEILRAG